MGVNLECDLLPNVPTLSMEIFSVLPHCLSVRASPGRATKGEHI